MLILGRFGKPGVMGGSTGVIGVFIGVGVGGLGEGEGEGGSGSV